RALGGAGGGILGDADVWRGPGRLSDRRTYPKKEGRPSCPGGHHNDRKGQKWFTPVYPSLGAAKHEERVLVYPASPEREREPRRLEGRRSAPGREGRPRSMVVPPAATTDAWLAAARRPRGSPEHAQRPSRVDRRKAGGSFSPAGAFGGGSAAIR